MKNPTTREAARPQGDTVPQQGDTQERAPRLPHERDESQGSQAADNASAKEIGRIALEGARQGQTDTDKGPVLDATYEALRKGDKTPHRG
jgi:hypothetical protein